jgi:hypothetical protein
VPGAAHARRKHLQQTGRVGSPHCSCCSWVGRGQHSRAGGTPLRERTPTALLHRTRCRHR